MRAGAVACARVTRVRRAAAVLLLGGALAPIGCARGVPAGSPLIVPSGADAGAAARNVAARARHAEIIYLGEQHDNPAHHAAQRQILEALVAAGARPVVAFEMLERGEQTGLGRALAEARAPDELARRLRWRERGWPDFSMYWPLFDLAATVGLPVVAADLERVQARRIARGGLAALGDDAAELRSLLAPDAAREAALAREIAEAHCGALPAERLAPMVEAWHARNVVMARRLVQALDRSGQVVVIIGRGHQQAGGLPAQVAALRPGTRQLVVDLVEAPAGVDPGRRASDSRGDVVWLTPPAERPDPCAALRPAPSRLSD